MTPDELKQQLAQEMLAKTGTGMVSLSTFKAIAELFPESVKAPDLLVVEGVRLFISPFIEDGKIMPFEKWDFKFPKVSLKPEPL